MRTAALVLALLAAAPAAASPSAWIGGFRTTTGRRVAAVMGGRNLVATAGEEWKVSCQAPSDLTVRSLTTNLITQPGGTTNRTFTMFKGATPTTTAATAISIAYSSTQTGLKTDEDAVFVTAGEWLLFESQVSGVPANSNLYFTFQIDSAVEGETFLCGTVSAVLVNQPDNMTIAGSSLTYCGGSSSTIDCAVVVPTPGTFRNLWCYSPTAPGGSGGSCTMTLRNFGSNTALTLDISGAENGDNDLANDVAGAAGDPVDVDVNCTAGAIALSLPFITCSAAFKPTVPGRFIIPRSPTSTNHSTTLTEYTIPWGNEQPAAGEGTVQQLAPGLQVKEERCRASGAPGAGTSYAMSLREDTADEGTTCTISGTNTSCTGVTESSVDSYSALALKSTPTGSPSARRIACAMTGRMIPGAISVLRNR